MLTKQSLLTDARAVVEGVPCPIKTDLGTLPADCPIFNVITIPEVITLGTTFSFENEVVVKAIRGSPIIIRHLATEL